MNEHDLIGVPVFDASGQIGRVVGVASERERHQPGDIWIALDGYARPVLISADQVHNATPERLTLAVSRDQLLVGNQTIRVPLHEEILEATTHEVERSHIRVYKTVETVPHKETVTVGRDDVSVERVSVGQVVDQAPEPRWEGDTLIIPLVEEVLVVAKRLRVREELRITRRRVDEPQTIRAELRREVADIDTEGPIDETGNT